VAVELPYERDDIESWFDTERAQESFDLGPGELVIAQIREKITLPNDLSGSIHSRNSIIRLGVNVGLSSYINPGYSGRLPIVIHNLGTFFVKLVPGIRICQLTFLETKTKTQGYGRRNDAKYQNESDITLSRLPEDQEIAEYSRAHGVKSKSGLGEYLRKRAEQNAQRALSELTEEQKRVLGLK
jgi:dCTP deaminase